MAAVIFLLNFLWKIVGGAKQVRVRSGVAQLLKLQSGHIWFGLVSLASFGQAWFALGELI